MALRRDLIPKRLLDAAASVGLRAPDWYVGPVSRLQEARSMKTLQDIVDESDGMMLSPIDKEQS